MEQLKYNWGNKMSMVIGPFYAKIAPHENGGWQFWIGAKQRPALYTNDESECSTIDEARSCIEHAIEFQAEFIR